MKNNPDTLKAGLTNVLIILDKLSLDDLRSLADFCQRFGLDRGLYYAVLRVIDDKKTFSPLNNNITY